MIEPAVVQRIREEVSLLDLAREDGIVLRRRGADWWASCPFHQEKSGSFKISEKRNGYKCFGCGAAGDVIGFYIATHGIDPKRGFPEAVKALAQRAGIFIEQSTGEAKERRAQRPKRTKAEIEAEHERKRAVALAERAKLAREQIVREWPWAMAELCEDSPVRLDEADGLDAARAVFGLFEPDDLVWAGDVQHSIAKEDVAGARADWKAEVARHFRRASDWVKARELPGPRVCACVFKAGTQFSRSQESVGRPRFLVIEHDALPLDEQGAMLRWLREKAGLRLRAVVFTGGKSLHGWFDYPLPHHIARLKLMLCGVQEETMIEGRTQRAWRGGLGFDAAIFNLVQPWKVPGWAHPKTGNRCTLAWLDASLRKEGGAA